MGQCLSHVWRLYEVSAVVAVTIFLCVMDPDDDDDDLNVAGIMTFVRDGFMGYELPKPDEYPMWSARWIFWAWLGFYLSYCIVRAALGFVDDEEPS